MSTLSPMRDKEEEGVVNERDMKFDTIISLYHQNSDANKTLTYWKDVARYYDTYSRAFRSIKPELFDL